MSWTEERVELLKRMWNDGQSASQIAKELGGVTRNAVIGKVHRLGLSNRGAAAGPADGAAATAAEPAPAAAAPAEPEPAADAAPAPAPEPDPIAAAPQAEELAEAAAAEGGSDGETAEAPARKPIPGQPLPPQPSTNEISPEALAKVSEVEKKARRITLMELTERTCKWPLGDPATEDFWFCGLPVQPGKPYCEAHVGVAFQPMSSRRDRKR
ncbi:GcrA family cell cycle regulator [Rhodosalinus sp.]|uniref:GcrA family cell cycle regulator n=1 Tax=Rhodosalinus sp. TaxID=2047741 RepID=UPI003568B63B